MAASLDFSQLVFPQLHCVARVLVCTHEVRRFPHKVRLRRDCPEHHQPRGKFLWRQQHHSQNCWLFYVCEAAGIRCVLFPWCWHARHQSLST
mmetsp:Transcript_79115/g.183576  ORF Transcript_79115/g.183576 Transcript_79115/m.183576 type:complete len:92 (-) Transcript_79115:93-368(-)